MGPTWGPPGSCRPKMHPMLAPRNLLSETRYNNNPTSYFCCLGHSAQWTLNQALALRRWVTICSSISRLQVKWAQPFPATVIKLLYVFALTATRDLALCKYERRLRNYFVVLSCASELTLIENQPYISIIGATKYIELGYIQTKWICTMATVDLVPCVIGSPHVTDNVNKWNAMKYWMKMY